MLGAAESFKACKFISEDAIEVNLDDKKTRTIYQFCRNMTQNYIDTYLAVAVALQAVQEAQMTLENRKLTAKSRTPAQHKILLLPSISVLTPLRSRIASLEVWMDRLRVF